MIDRHAGILFGISNTVATIPGMLAPTVVGLITPGVSKIIIYIARINSTLTR